MRAVFVLGLRRRAPVLVSMILLVVATSKLLGQPQLARADAVFDHRIIAGIAGTTENCKTWDPNDPNQYLKSHYKLYCWHDDYNASWALDLNVNPASTGGKTVFFEDFAIAGHITATTSALVGTDCTGITIALRDAETGLSLGELYYLHIVVDPTVPATIDVPAGGWTIVQLGTVALRAYPVRRSS